MDELIDQAAVDANNNQNGEEMMIDNEIEQDAQGQGQGRGRGQG